MEPEFIHDLAEAYLRSGKGFMCQILCVSEIELESGQNRDKSEGFALHLGNTSNDNQHPHWTNAAIVTQSFPGASYQGRRVAAGVADVGKLDLVGAKDDQVLHELFEGLLLRSILLQSYNSKD